MGINGVTKRPQAVWAAQRADGTPPCVFSSYYQTWWVSRAREHSPAHAPRFFPISLRTLVLRSPTHAVGWIPRDRGMPHGCTTARSQPRAGPHQSYALPGACLPGYLRDVGAEAGQHLEALDNDLTGAAGRPLLLPAPL